MREFTKRLWCKGGEDAAWSSSQWLTANCLHQGWSKPCSTSPLVPPVTHSTCLMRHGDGACYRSFLAILWVASYKPMLGRHSVDWKWIGMDCFMTWNEFKKKKASFSTLSIVIQTWQSLTGFPRLNLTLESPSERLNGPENHYHSIRVNCASKTNILHREEKDWTDSDAQRGQRSFHTKTHEVQDNARLERRAKDTMLKLNEKNYTRPLVAWQTIADFRPCSVFMQCPW